MVLYCLKEVFEIVNVYVDIVGVIGEFLNTLALAVYFIIGKSNRVIWGTYLKNRSLKMNNIWGGTKCLWEKYKIVFYLQPDMLVLEMRMEEKKNVCVY